MISNLVLISLCLNVFGWMCLLVYWTLIAIYKDKNNVGERYFWISVLGLICFLTNIALSLIYSILK